MSPDTHQPLTADDTARLIDFARACKAAARAVLLYPEAHPAIATTLGRIAQQTTASAIPGGLRLTVLGNTLRLNDRAPARTDVAIHELATLLHAHLIGELTVHPDGEVEAWRSFLLLLGRAPEEVRAEGGIARLWTTMAGRHVEIREINYAEVLRERTGTAAAGWSDVIEHCLRGGSELDAHARQLLLDAGVDREQLAALVAALDLEATAEGGGTASRAAGLVRLLDRIVKLVSEHSPDLVEPVMANLASTLGQLTPDVVAALLTDTVTATSTPGVVGAIASHMSEADVAGFVARHALTPGTPVERLATAFQTLVPEDRRERVLSLAHDQAAQQADASGDFDGVWENVAQQLMTSYTDEAYVSAQYGQELSSAKTVAIDVEHLSDDPPERMAVWLGSVSASELRRLDLALVNDLLRIEQDPERWATLMRPVVALVEDLLLVGDFDPADELIGALVGRQLAGGAHRPAAGDALAALIAGPMLRHVASHLTTADDATFARIKTLCLSLGDDLVRPLAETLIDDATPRVRERLSAILVAFGPRGRNEVETLKQSSNAAVRRTAIHLLREFGGDAALSDLTELLHDPELQVQREAIRAILGIGTPEAHRIVGDALMAGPTEQREAMLSALTTSREHERTAPVFAYLVDHVDHRGPLTELYLRAIQALGTPRSNDGIAALTRALPRGEWWAPRRTAALRESVATALARIGTPEARAVLESAVADGSRGVRSAARAALSAMRLTAGGRT